MMKRIAIFVFLFSASVTCGQTAKLTWVASNTAGVTGYNVYRAPCTGTITGSACSSAGPFAKLNAALIAGVTYTDATGAPGTVYDYYVTAMCPTACTPAESAASNHFAVTIPSGLKITNTSRTSSGNRVTVTAAWTDAPLIKTTYTLAYAQTGAVLTTGSLTNATGNYSMTWTGKVTPPSAALAFKVCDTTGACATQTF
jgi:hypothetical protein